MSDMRLIDANVLTRWLEMVLSNANPLDRKARAAFSEVLARVKTMPDIDAVPVVHGRWEWYEDWGPSTWLEPPDLNKAGWKCSNCGIDLGDYLTDCLGVNVYVDEEDKMPKIKSCPNCGAKMDGGAEG